MSGVQDRTRAKVEDLFELDDQRAHLDEVLTRLGIPTDDALEKFCRNHDIAALYQRIKHRSHDCTPGACPDTIPEQPANPYVVVRLLHSGADLPPRDQRDWVTSQELLEHAGITYRQLDYWTRTELLHPMTAHRPGSGHLRCFDEHQADRARTLRELLDAGVALTTCRQIIDDFLATGSVDIGPITIAHHTTQEAG